MRLVRVKHRLSLKSPGSATQDFPLPLFTASFVVHNLLPLDPFTSALTINRPASYRLFDILYLCHLVRSL